MELESVGMSDSIPEEDKPAFGTLLTVEKVQVLQTISVEHLEGVLAKIGRELSVLAEGPKAQEIQAMRDELQALRKESESNRGENRLQADELRNQQVKLEFLCSNCPSLCTSVFLTEFRVPPQFAQAETFLTVASC